MVVVVVVGICVRCLVLQKQAIWKQVFFFFFPGQCTVYLKLFVSFLSPSMQMGERYLNQVTTASSKNVSNTLFTSKPNIWRYTRSLKY
jgi:hypothetical protein